MEIVYTDTKHELFEDNKIIGLYGDIQDLLIKNVDIEGIIYNDEVTVKRFLNGLHITINKKIFDYFKLFELDEEILNKKIYEIPKTDLKYILLIYTLIHDKKYIILDYFEYGLTIKEQKKLINKLRLLKEDKCIIIVSKNLVFLSKIVDKLIVVNNNEFIFNGTIKEFLSSDIFKNYDLPIIDFINKVHKKGGKLDNTLDDKELLKDIYRSVN